MGRKKQGKPGRTRKGTYTLQQLQPSGYDEWIRVQPGVTADSAAADDRLTDDAVDLMKRLARLRPFYRGPIPMQAARLDMVLDSGSFPLSSGDGETAVLVPVQEAAALMGAGSTMGDVREASTDSIPSAAF